MKIPCDVTPGLFGYKYIDSGNQTSEYILYWVITTRIIGNLEHICHKCCICYEFKGIGKYMWDFQ